MASQILQKYTFRKNSPLPVILIHNRQIDLYLTDLSHNVTSKAHLIDIIVVKCCSCSNMVAASVAMWVDHVTETKITGFSKPATGVETGLVRRQLKKLNKLS